MGLTNSIMQFNLIVLTIGGKMGYSVQYELVQYDCEPVFNLS